jgi:4'-phosphopantetheinyl transferase
MPLIRIIYPENNKACILGIWEIVEHTEYLIDHVNFERELVSEWKEIHHDAKKREWLAAKILAEKLCQQINLKYSGITKDEFGKPWLLYNTAHISVSHSSPYVAIIIHIEKPVGIDIEPVKDKILSIQKRFLSLIELEDTENQVEKLIKYWCCKESLYKVYGKKGLIFASDIRVHLTENSGTGVVEKDSYFQKFDLNLFNIENHRLAYCY